MTIRTLIVVVALCSLPGALGLHHCRNGNACKEGLTCVNDAPFLEAPDSLFNASSSKRGEVFYGLASTCAPAMPEGAKPIVCAADLRFACPHIFEDKELEMCNVTRSKVEGGANDTARCIYAGGALFKEAEVLLPAVPVRGLVPAKGVGSALAGSSVCSYVQPYLPGICSCQGLTYGFDAKCNVQIPNVATLGLQAVVNPCGWSPEASIYVTAQNLYRYKLFGISSPNTHDVPIPGASWSVPYVGEVGLSVAVSLGGSLQGLSMAVGVDGCAKVLGFGKCGRDVSPYLPFNVFNSRWSFPSSVC
eukprot:g525.t1